MPMVNLLDRFFHSKKYAILKYIMRCDVMSVIFAYDVKLTISRKNKVDKILRKKLTTYFTLSFY